MYGMLLCLQYFVECFAMLLKYNETRKAMVAVNVAPLVAAALVILCVSGAFYVHPTLFGSFLYDCEKKAIFALEHYHIHILVLISAVLLLTLLPIFSCFCGIPLLLMLIYTAIRRPYKVKVDNVRSAFNLLAMCCFVGFKVWMEYSPQ